ncbi:hypothetical protein SAMN05444000_102219 [Shimia gijangensis]|uniref:Fe2OG dioxygenase domain-containing protein n=1 Tax=Shimia gijangensis TaxID=1470563 RepID=A0A1M6D3H3_9RHOB|nr:2OG-Fe(II) oxygenase [Shimia gijangensis]SHI67749.1 hypothetical protein SAMN05444000_102219 [Shimia gijangensis]
MRDIIDLDRYSLDQPDSDAWRALVDRCRVDLARDGMFNLEGLMLEDIAAKTAAESAPRFAKEAFRHEREHNIYFQDRIEGLADDHPALARFQTSNLTLCADQFKDDPLTRLYEWRMFSRFLAATMDKPALFTMDDPLASWNLMSYDAGQALNWHFDRSEFTTTMLMQAPDKGGEFIYRTDLRTHDDPNYDGVARMLRGEDDQVQSLTLTPGTLNVFRGKNTPHRVGQVSGDKARIIAVFSFYNRPGVRFSDAERIGFYGRSGPPQT